MFGIYCIENIINKKKYFGQSHNTKNRLGIHKRKLFLGTHENKRLQFDWNEFGEKNFIFFHLIECKKVNSDAIEKFFISFFETKNPEKGYNIQSGGKSHDISLEGKTNMSKSSFGIRRKKNNYSKYVGVSFKKRGWESHIKSFGKETYIGRFLTEEEAALAYDIQSLKDRNVCFNFPKEIVEKADIPQPITTHLSKYIGVTIRGSGKFRCRILVNGKGIDLGTYFDEIEAAKKYDEYVISNGLNRRLNFPNE